MQANLTLRIDTKGVCKFSYKVFKQANQLTAKVYLTFKDERISFERSASNAYYLSKKINFKISSITSGKENDELCEVTCLAI